MISKTTKIISLTTLCILMLTACQKETSCQVNGLAIDKSIIGIDREHIISKIGQPRSSTVEVKGFDEWTFSAGRKRYAVVLRYKLKNNTYYVSDQKCVKVKAKLEVSNY